MYEEDERRKKEVAKKKHSIAGNRTRGIRVRAENVTNYTTTERDCMMKRGRKQAVSPLFHVGEEEIACII